MNKVFISRPDGNTSWGFRLQGGFEYNEPLTVTNILPNSPADGKIDPGDMLIEIAGNNVTYITHQDALELIQRCGNALFLTVQKVGHSYPPGVNQPRSADQRSYGYNQPSASMSAAHIPPPPIFDPELIARAAVSLRSRQPLLETHTAYEQTTEFSNLPAILAKSFGRPGGPKPFTYTPGGLNLSEIREAARARRHREFTSNSEGLNDQIMNRRMILPPDQMDQHHYAGTNPIQPFSYARQQPSAAKKYIQHDTDAITQSRSFQMLQGWISDSEKIAPTSVVPATQSPRINRSVVTRGVPDEHDNTDRRASSGGISSHPSRSFRYLQEQYNNDDDNNNTTITTSTKTVEEIVPSTRYGSGGLRRSSDAHTPSRSFKFLQDQYDTSEQLSINRPETVNNRDDLIEIYNRPPPSFREREPEAPRYTGSTVPSRSFRFLQMMTQDEKKPVDRYTQSQQSLLNKYDEQNLLTNNDRLHDHPSRSFKYLQEMTGEQQSPARRISSANGRTYESQPAVHGNLSNKPTRNDSTNIGASDF